MAKRHMKRQSAPKQWRIERKGTKFIVRPNAGKKFSLSLPLALVFKEYLGYAKTTKEVNNILQDKEIIVDGKRRKDKRYSVGFMDVLSIPVAKEDFRMLIDDKGKLFLLPIDKEESGVKVCKIANKNTINKEIVQINFSDGRNIRIKKSDDKFKVGDSVKIKLSPKQEIVDHLAFEKGCFVFLVGGKHIGKKGSLEKIDKNYIEVKAGDNVFITDKKYAYVLGKEKSEIKLDA